MMYYSAHEKHLFFLYHKNQMVVINNLQISYGWQPQLLYPWRVIQQ